MIEIGTSTGIGFIGSWLITYLVMSYVNLPTSVQATITVVLCTIWSLVRGYSIRRYFNKASK